VDTANFIMADGARHPKPIYRLRDVRVGNIAHLADDVLQRVDRQGAARSVSNT
jgi:hypothetical protein